MHIYRDFFKHLIDVIFALCVLIVLSPVLVIVFVCLVIANKGRAFFYQKRPGKDAKIFKIVKFKTMTDERDVNGEFLPDHLRITAVGAFVRKTSLDELPQLINVLAGQMSLIGPRPLLPEYLALYNEEQFTRHKVKPGITGWAQVNGRNAISWEEKFKLDCWYVNNISFLLDLKILFLTLKKVFIREGISADNSATMEKFTGN